MSVFRSIFSAAIILMVAGCGPKVEKHACLKMGGGADPLVVDAVLFRLDVYGAGVRCSGAVVAAGSGAPLMSHTYGRGQPIALDVPPGPHTLVLATYADAAAQHQLGSGCTATTLSAGAQICFDLTLAPVGSAGGDGGSDGEIPAIVCSSSTQCAGTDDAGASSQQCCSNGCVDIEHSVDNCGGCGMTCSTSHIARHCSLGGCDGACLAGYGDCNGDKRRDGCETELDTATNCGACGATCDSSQSIGPSCNEGNCTYSSCQTGFMDCDATPPNSNGCECPTATAAFEGTPGCCGSGCQSQHNNGLGQLFYDCTKLGTHNEQQASAACTAYAMSKGGSSANCTSYTCGSSSQVSIVCSDALGTSMFPCYCWGFGGSETGHAYAGCFCPGSSDPMWN
jgi:hypothetical protein